MVPAVPWVIRSSGKAWDGEVHVLRDAHYSGATRTPESQRVVWIASSSKPKPIREKAVRKKQGPPPPLVWGKTAWD